MLSDVFIWYKTGRLIDTFIEIFLKSYAQVTFPSIFTLPKSYELVNYLHHYTGKGTDTLTGKFAQI